MKTILPNGAVKVRCGAALRKGSASIMIVLMLSLLTIIPVAMMISGRAHQDTGLAVHVAEADNVARAGIIDALAWFRRAGVTGTVGGGYNGSAFFPRFNANPDMRDTLDENIGLVKEYQLNSQKNLWARYEIRRQKDPNLGSVNAALPVDAATNPPNPIDPLAAHDITNLRASAWDLGQGVVWGIESKGYVFQKNTLDPTVAFNKAPNVVLATSRISSEFRRLYMDAPYSEIGNTGAGPAVNAAIITDNADNVRIDGLGRSIIRGGNVPAIGYYTGAGNPTINNPANKEIRGTPTNLTFINGGFDTRSVGTGRFNMWENVFKVEFPDSLVQMADVIANTAVDLPQLYPAMSLVYIRGNADFTPQRPLNGSGILFVGGNMTVTDPKARFDGLICVNGNFSITGVESSIYGRMIVRGTVTVTAPNATDKAEIVYDPGTVTYVRNQIAVYRETKTSVFLYTGLK